MLVPETDLQDILLFRLSLRERPVTPHSNLDGRRRATLRSLRLSGPRVTELAVEEVPIRGRSNRLQQLADTSTLTIPIIILRTVEANKRSSREQAESGAERGRSHLVGRREQKWRHTTATATETGFFFLFSIFTDDYENIFCFVFFFSLFSPILIVCVCV